MFCITFERINSEVMLLSGFLILLTDEFSRCFFKVWAGPDRSDSINRLIQLSVIQLSGGHCMCKIFHSKDKILRICKAKKY